MIADCTVVFSVDPTVTGPGSATVIGENVIHTGRFESGGHLLAFDDGRPPITRLAILQRHLPNAVTVVRQFYRP